jgi:thiol-disulfide isomerase/thioredoxin
MRRLPEDPISEARHYVPFVFEYLEGRPHRAWCDLNLNGDLSDDPEPTLFDYPGHAGAKCFLADLAWTARRGTQDYRIAWKVRVVGEPISDLGQRPVYRVQRVLVPMGEIVLDGTPHRAFLFDGNGDGLYTKDRLDGVFVDLDDDRHFEVDPLSPEFGPFRIAFQWDKHICAIDSVAASGDEVLLRQVGMSDPPVFARVGEPAPAFVLHGVDGQAIDLGELRGRLVILYFWASWCGACKKEAAQVADLYQRFSRRDLEILGVSYDSDRGALQAFRREHGETWPTSFTGGLPSEDPVGRLYQEHGAGVFYLIDRRGRLRGVYYDAKTVSESIARLAKS